MDKTKIMTRSEVRAFDARAINELGIPGVVLMENAGTGAAEIIKTHFHLGLSYDNVAIFCGTGNNGGDGFVIARHLLNKGIAACVIMCGDERKISGDALINYNIFEKIGTFHGFIDPQKPNAGTEASKIIEQGRYTLIVDAIFGTGLEGQLRGYYPDIIDAINKSNTRIAAIDIPSGLDCDSGKPLTDTQGNEIAVKADITVTFVAVKQGFHICPESIKYTGQVYVQSIGIERT